MGKKQTYTITEIIHRQSLLRTAPPFDIVVNGQVICTVIPPSKAEWRPCENCGENTQNIIEFEDKHLKWQKLILCDKCSNEFI